MARKISNLIFLLCICLSVLSSCDPGSKIKYQILNKTSKPIKIKYQFPDGRPVLYVTIYPHSIKVIQLANELGYVDGINERKDSIYFYNFEVIQGKRISTRNFKDKKYWTFSIVNRLKASYTLNIDNSFFN